MRTLGTVITLIAVIGGIALLLFSFIFKGSSPSGTASTFMEALTAHDIDKLTDLTYIQGKDKATIRKEWEFTLNTAAPYHVFNYELSPSVEDSPTDAQAKVVVKHIKYGTTAIDDNYMLPLTKVDGSWKVAVTSINREMFPGLPR